MTADNDRAELELDDRDLELEAAVDGVRAMTKPERRAYLGAHGWTCLGRTDRRRGCTHPIADGLTRRAGDRGFYTLAAAIRAALADIENEQHKAEGAS